MKNFLFSLCTSVYPLFVTNLCLDYEVIVKNACYSSHVRQPQADSCLHENLTVAERTKGAPFHEQRGCLHTSRRVFTHLFGSFAAAEHGDGRHPHQAKHGFANGADVNCNKCFFTPQSQILPDFWAYLHRSPCPPPHSTQTAAAE